jgi:endonuclease/exonuclease/phosphatase family metal-dependent hydrolase
MAGDFNAVTRVDNWHLGRPEDDKAFLLNDYVRSQTPYIDLIERLYPGEYQKSTFSGRRIDFIYMTEPLFSKVTEARTIYDGFATASRDPRRLNNFCNPSDHYPIAVTLEF